MNKYLICINAFFTRKRVGLLWNCIAWKKLYPSKNSGKFTPQTSETKCWLYCRLIGCLN